MWLLPEVLAIDRETAVPGEVVQAERIQFGAFRTDVIPGDLLQVFEDAHPGRERCIADTHRPDPADPAAGGVEDLVPFGRPLDGAERAHALVELHRGLLDYSYTAEGSKTVNPRNLEALGTLFKLG